MVIMAAIHSYLNEINSSETSISTAMKKAQADSSALEVGDAAHRTPHQWALAYSLSGCTDSISGDHGPAGSLDFALRPFVGRNEIPNPNSKLNFSNQWIDVAVQLLKLRPDMGSCMARLSGWWDFLRCRYDLSWFYSFFLGSLPCRSFRDLNLPCWIQRKKSSVWLDSYL